MRTTAAVLFLTVCIVSVVVAFPRTKDDDYDPSSETLEQSLDQILHKAAPSSKAYPKSHKIAEKKDPAAKSCFALKYEHTKTQEKKEAKAEKADAKDKKVPLCDPDTDYYETLQDAVDAALLLTPEVSVDIEFPTMPAPASKTPSKAAKIEIDVAKFGPDVTLSIIGGGPKTSVCHDAIKISNSSFNASVPVIISVVAPKEVAKAIQMDPTSVHLHGISFTVQESLEISAAPVSIHKCSFAPPALAPMAKAPKPAKTAMITVQDGAQLYLRKAVLVNATKGALEVKNSSVYVADSTFKDNAGESAIEVKSAFLGLDSVSIIGTVAAKSTGGALKADKGSSIYFTGDIDLEDNNAKSGGAIAAFKSTFVCDMVEFKLVNNTSGKIKPVVPGTIPKPNPWKDSFGAVFTILVTTEGVCTGLPAITPLPFMGIWGSFVPPTAGGASPPTKTATLIPDTANIEQVSDMIIAQANKAQVSFHPLAGLLIFSLLGFALFKYMKISRKSGYQAI